MTKNRTFYFSLLLAVIVLALGGVTAAYAGWNAPVPATVDSTADVGEYTSLAVLADGNPAISYYDWDNGDLKYVRATDSTGSSWGSPIIVAGAGGADVGLYTSLAVVDGNPAISYYDNGSGDLKYVRATDSTGSSWGSPVTIDSGGDVGLYTSLVVVDGYPAISYYDSSNSDLKYVRATDSTGSSWGTPATVDSDDNVGECTSLAVVNGYPAISYFDSTNGNLEYVRATDAAGSSWDTSVTVTSDGYVGADTSLAVVNGNPAISYYDIGNGDLKYVRATDAAGSSWGSPLTLDSTGDVGEYTSLAVVVGYPVISYYPAISYYDGANGDLKYVQATDADGGSWGSPLTLDSAGTVGRYTSLEAVNGYPAVSYYDSTNDDLKYLYFIPAAEIAVLGNGAVIATGDTSPSLANSTMFLTPGGAIAHTFTISNSGELALNLTGSPVISITGPAAGDFSVTTLPVTPVSANSSTTFQVSFAPSVAGTRAATLTIANNDPDENPYEFALQGNICSNAITVQNANDSGAGSLRQALADICDGGAIDFAADTAITLTSPLAVNRSVTVTGQGHAVTVSGNDAVRVFAVMDNAHVSFDHLTIAHGKVITPEIGSKPTGGGVKIEAGAVVTLTNSAVLSNSAVYYNAGYDMYFGSGGGIYNLGTLTVLTSTLSGNTSGSNAGWGDGSGGAIYSSGALTVINSTLSGNSAYNDSGGGIENDGGTLTVQNSTISGNTANCGGVGISSSRGTAAISDSTVTDNEVTGNCEKGAAGISNRFGTMTVDRTTISGNKQAYSSGGGLSSYGYNPDQARLTVTDSSIYSNTTGSSGGGIHNWWDSVMTVTNSSIYSNTATYYGGGILSGPHANAKLTLINSTLAHNTAEDGGGQYNGSPGYSAAVLNMINSTVVSNTATNLGGGIYNHNSANATLDNIILWGNTAPTGPQIYNNSSTNQSTTSYSDIEGSGTWDTVLGSDGGDNLDSDPKLGPLADNTLSGTGGGETLTIALLSGSPAIDAGDPGNCPATDQRGVTRPQGMGCDIGAYEVEMPEMAVIGHGLTISAGDTTPVTNDDTDFGNALVSGGQITRTFTISNSGAYSLTLIGTPVVTITGPAAGDFSVMSQPGATVGPGLTTTFTVRFGPTVVGTRVATVTIANDDSNENPYDFAVQGTGLCAGAVTVQNNADSGAGSLRQAIADVCTGGTIDFVAGLGGQTITLTSTELSIAKTVTITNPNAPGLSVSGDNARRVFNIQASGVVTISHLSIVSGTSTSGGGIRNTGTLTLQDSTLAGNSAGDSGGGLYNSSSNATLTNVTFSGNLAKFGGGMYVTSSSPTLTNITFNNNSANSGGGMFNAYGSNPGLTNVTFSNNSAGIGGGMFNTIGSSPTLTNVTFSDNSATSGGGMYNHSSSPILTNVTISGNSATSQGGGIFNATSSNPTLTNVTISGNSAAEGGGMSNYDCSPSIRNTIFRDNTAGTGAQIYNDADSTPSVSDSVVQGGYLTGTNIITGDPLLGTLGNYGGSTETIPLLPGSAAIDAGASCPATDQRGVTRPQGAGCDIGAFESRGFTLTSGGGSQQITLVNTAFAYPLTLTVTSAYTEPVDGGRVILTGPGSGAGVQPAVYTATISHTLVTQVVTANSTVGSYVVTATTRGSLGGAVSFTLTNGIPEMAVLGNGQVLTNGDATPSLTDHTDFGSAAIAGGVVTRTFTISNSGNLTLTLTGSPVVTITGPAAGDFSVTAQPITPVGPGGSTTFTVRFAPTVLGTRMATVTIANDDSNENPYTFVVQGLGAAPEMAVLGNGLTITTGDTTPATNDDTNFGSAAVSGGQITRTFTISNSGAYSLTLTGSPVVTITGPAAGDFSVTAQPVTPIGPGGSTPFTIRFAPTVLGTRAATVTIANDDSNENPYTFAVQGTGLCAGAVTVANLNDGGAGSLRQAIGDVCTDGTITFDPSLAGQTIKLTSGQLSINKNLTIDGSSLTTPITIQNASHTFNIANAVVTLDSLVIDKGVTGDYGGGMYNYRGTVTVKNCTFSNNFGTFEGGAIYNREGTLTVINSTFYNNQSHDGSGGGYGGAISNNGGTLTVINSTFSGNSAGYASAIAIYGGSTLTVTNSTFSGNSGNGTIINDGSNSLTITNSLIANSTGSNCLGSSFDSASSSNNLADDNTCGSTFTESDSILLGALGNYGGSTETFPLLPGSAAIDAGVSCPATDQRGVARGTTCDIGAFESQGFSLTKTGGDHQTTFINTAFATPLNLTVTSAFTEPVDGGRVIFTGPGSGAGVQPAVYTATISHTLVTQVVTANNTAGSYVVTATTRGRLGSAVSFTLTNGIPEMAVLGNGQVIANGEASPSLTDHTDFGSALVSGGQIIRTFTISNSGAYSLTLTGSPVVTITGPAALDFSVTAQPVTPVGPGGSTTFTVRFAPSITGTRAATVTIANDDSDENPYDFAVVGTGTTPSVQFVYLPLLMRDFVSAPDLIIDSLSSDANGPRVVIRNAGNAAVTNAFWVEVYYNPDETPGLNKIWPLIAPAGAVWGVSEDIAPGGILTLTVGSSYYFPQYSSAGFPADVPVYGYVDSVNYATDYGAVRESNEGNNLFGAVTSTAGGEATSVGSPKNNPVSATLPGR